jgi:hypothetical protein
MVRYNIEVKYLSFGKEHTSEVYYNALDNLNEEEKERVLQGYLDIVETYKGFEGFLESHIWKDKEEKKVINLNKLKNYKSIAYATPLAQLEKVKEEFNELLNEVEVKSLSYSFIKNIDNFKAEALDLITATVNLLLLTGLTDEDFNKHIEKLNDYRNGKYKKEKIKE